MPILNDLSYNFLTAMSSDGWSINGFLANLRDSLFSWGKIIVVIIGVTMVIVGVFNIAKGLMSGGRGQTNWVLNLALFFIGGAIAFTGGWGLVQAVADGGAKTLNDLGTGQIAESIVIDGDVVPNTIDLGSAVAVIE